MPKKRDVPELWHSGDDVHDAWEQSGAAWKPETWLLKTTYVHLRTVPWEVGLDLAEDGWDSVKDGPGVNCTTRAWFMFFEIMDWYNRKKLGRPAAGFTIQRYYEGDRLVRHATAWCFGPKGLWALEARDAYPITEGPKQYEWAVC